MKQKGFEMDILESQLKDEIGKLYQNTSDNELSTATLNLVGFYKLLVEIMQENQASKIPKNSSENAEK